MADGLNGDVGEWPLHANTAYAIEGNIAQALPEQGDQWWRIKLEQGALFDGERVVYIAGLAAEPGVAQHHVLTSPACPKGEARTSPRPNGHKGVIP